MNLSIVSYLTIKEITAKAGAAWEKLIQLTAAEDTITYGSLTEAVGLGKVYARSARYFLHPIQEFCQRAGLPPLTVVVTDWKGDRGAGYVGEPDLTVEEIAWVYGFDWVEVPNPFIQVGGVSWLDRQAETLLSPEVGVPRLSELKHRGIRQQVFRAALLKIYRRCAVCGVSHPDFLEAAHLKPWRLATDEERVDVRNGLLLCRNHHVGFDRGWWKITKRDGRYTVGMVRKGKVASGLPLLASNALKLPNKKAWHPLEKWLLKRT